MNTSTRHGYIGLIAMALLCSACASSTLTIKVDLYDEDPRVVLPMSPARAHTLVTDLRKLEAEATNAVSLRSQLAIDSAQIFITAWRTLGGDELRVTEMEKQLGQHIKKLHQDHESYENSVQAAVDSLRSYVKEYETKFGVLDKERIAFNSKLALASDDENKTANKNKPPDTGDGQLIKALRNELRQEEITALDLVSDAVSSYRNLGATEIGFSVDWPALEYLLNASIQGAELVGDDKQKQLYEQLGNTLKTSIRSLAVRAQESTGTVLRPKGQLRAPHRPTTMAGSSFALANEVESLRNDLPESATSRAALAGLVQGSSRLFELVDRLQDAGDPVWRTVTDPDNELHWNERFAKTYSYAEGNSSVVIVRDNPMRFRTQDASNNPLALVQGQLEISRSLANAALSIAGTATGLPTSGLASSVAGSSTASAVDTTGDNLASRKAQADAWAKLRSNTLESMQRYLRSIASNLANTDDTQTKAIDTQRRRLQSVLESHIGTFEIAPE